MLTKDTKDRIDRARQILVGQLPLPSDQIELITIALIYKFMDDMDEQSRDLGGQASFFVGKLRDYSWREIVANKLDAKERVDRFVKGVEQLSDPKDNPIPELFQSIFRNTFVKFRDGRTLKLFLDELNGFTYDHSEELGNAFEYLLETMGTQADNGQFRTPRHIIDFVVAAVAPQLGQTILDPACGTAGFLISAFRHIIATHTSEPEKGRARRPGDRLTAEQRQQLTRDVVGYDITPQMARLSRVNMYLHQFASPVIHEYDTITNTARWDEKFDVILANPPFMSPHGGNQTHDKFRIAASRTEVLFADYILEHLLPDGRAGFIVPEGIIFQNNGDYVALRKWLIEEGGLWAVASLPAGVFQPYSGVKTSVLFIDRALARRRSDVLLLKIENDGFGLNTNRNPIAGNDLPAALQLVEAARGEDYREALAKLASPVQHRLVSRADFARLDTYRANSAAWDFCRKRQTRLTKAETELAALRAEVDTDPRAITRAERALARLREEFPADTGLPSVPADAAELKSEFESRIKASAIAYGDDPKAPTTLSIGLRDCLDGQREYSLGIEASTPALASANEVREVAIGDLCERLQYGLSAPMNTDGNGSRCFRMNEIVRGRMHDGGSMKCVPLSDADFRKYRLEVGDVMFNRTNSYEHVGRTGLFTLPGDYVFASYLVRLTIKREVALPEYVNAVMNSHIFQTRVKKLASRAIGQANISASNLAKFPIPVPPMEEQQNIVLEIEGYQRVVDGCAALLAGYRPRFEVAPAWPRARVETLATLDYGFTTTGLAAGKTRLIRITDITDAGTLAVEEPKFAEMTSDAEAFRVKPGDLFIARTGASFGDCLLIEEPIDAIFASYLIRLRFDDSILPKFFWAFTKSDDYWQQARKLATGAGQPQFNANAICKIEVPIPPLEIQRSIITEITREQATLAGVAELKAKHEARIRARLAAVWGETPGTEIASSPSILPPATADAEAA